MIKRLIFDLDNTLIMWKDEYKNAIKNIIEYYQLDIDYLLVHELIENYEQHYDQYTKENMVTLINQKFHLNLDVEFIDRWLKELHCMAEVDEHLVETLEYLVSKYELVILTNWFRESQINRMKHVQIDHYFKEIYGGDYFIKPNPNSFQIACGNRKKEECIMIGDTYQTDIEGAINFGMKAIMITKKKVKETDQLKVIRDIKELKEIL